MIGHDKIERRLAKSICSNTIAPAWIFCGQDGVGKMTMACRFAACLLSKSTAQSEYLDFADEKIEGFIKNNTHPDCFIIDKEDEALSMDDARALIAKIRKKAAISDKKVAIVNNASNLSKNIFNALLKILEEPPAGTVIILICRNVGNIPKTLLSRVAKVDFYPVDEALILNFLMDHNVEAAKELAKLSNGSIGYAMMLHKNNGIKIYQTLLRGFSRSDLKKQLAYVIENDIAAQFEIVKNSFFRILTAYINLINATDDRCYLEEYEVFKSHILSIKCIDDEVKRVLDIFYMLNICEKEMLDKKTVICGVYERFFN